MFLLTHKRLFPILLSFHLIKLNKCLQNQSLFNRMLKSWMPILISAHIAIPIHGYRDMMPLLIRQGRTSDLFVSAAIGHFEVFVGLKAKASLKDVPVELLLKILPPATYAVFTLQGQQIVSDWAREIYYDWMPRSGYQKAHNYGFQYYDQRFKSMQALDESELDVYVPIVQKAESRESEQ